jgi:hypothetical protein
MEGNARTRFTPKQRAEVWDRWRNGQCIADIARALERRNKSGVYRVLALNGGITPAARGRAPLALALQEREEISRGIARGSIDTPDRGEAWARGLDGKSGGQAARRT